MKPKLHRILAAAMILLTGIQPVLASTYQYNVYVKGLAPAKHSPGEGLGAIDPGFDPIAPIHKPVPAPQLALSPDKLKFSLAQGEGPTTYSTDLVNVGTAPAMLGGAIVSNRDFTVSNNCPDTLQPSASCTISVTFEQTGQGEVSYVMPLDVSGQPNPVALSLSAVVPASQSARPRLMAMMDLVDLGKLNPGEVGQGKATLVNQGSMAADISGIKAAKGFNVTNDCPARLEPQESCTITASYSSYAPGSAQITLSIAGEAEGVPIPLTFKAFVISNPDKAPVLSFDGKDLDFGSQDPGSTVSKTTKLTNSGTVPATLSLTTASPDFNISSNCPSSLAANDSCIFTVSHTANTGNPYPAFQLQASSIESPTALALAFLHGSTLMPPSPPGATDAGLAFSPENLAFGSVSLGSSSNKSVKLTNKGSDTATLMGLGLEYSNYGDLAQENDCGSTLAAGASCNVTLTFSPNQIYPSYARVRVLAKTGAMSVLGVSGQGVGAIPVASPSQLDFGALAVGSPAVAKNVTLNNKGNVDLGGLSFGNTDSRVSINNGDCGTTLKAGQSCLFAISYSPSTLGLINNAVTVNSTNARPLNIALTGAVVKVQVTPTILSFGDTRVGQSAPVQAFTFTNQGSSPLAVDGITVSSGITDYSQANNCGTVLAAGMSCTVNIGYTPTFEGTRTGTVSFVSLGTVVAQAQMTGIASAPGLTLTPSPVQFPPTSSGNTSLMKMVVKNPTTGTVAVSGMGIVDGADVFSQSNNCGTELASGQSCEVTLLAAPNADGSYSGSWGLTSSLGDKITQLSVFAGTPKVEIPDLPPPTPDKGDGFVHYTIKFLDTEYGKSSAVRNVTLSNTGTGPLKVLGLSMVNGLADFAQSNNCGKAVEVGQSCTIALLFSPSAGGGRTGGMALQTENGKFFFDLSGNGIGPEGAWSGVTDFGMVPAGQSARRTFTLKNTGLVVAKNVGITLQGTDLTLASNTCGTPDKLITLEPDALCSVSVEYAPSVVGSQLSGTLAASGNWIGGPISASIKGMSPKPGLAFDAVPSGDFGTNTVGALVTRTFYLRNVGKLSDSLTAVPNVSGDGFSRIDGSCLKGTVLPPDSTCTVVVGSSALAAGVQQGLVSATSTNRAGADIALTGNALQSSYAVSATMGSNTTPNPDFGSLSVGASTSTTRDFYLRDDTNIATVVAKNVSISGSSSFTITAMDSSDYGGWAASNCAFSPTGSTGPCSTGSPSRVIHIRVLFAKAAKGANTATLRIEHNGTGGFNELQLTGTGMFDVQAAAAENVNGFDYYAVNGNMGTLSYDPATGNAGGSISKVIYVQNLGKYGKLAVTPTLSGDDDFKIDYVYKNTYYTWQGMAVCGANPSSDGKSSGECTADDISETGEPYVVLRVTFTPKGPGTRKANLTLAHNGLNTSPIVIPLTGAALYNVTAEAAENTNGFDYYPVNSDMGSTTYDPNTKTAGGTLVKNIFVRNTGQYGKLSVTPTLTGDEDFKIVSVSKNTYYTWQGNAYCGADLTSDGRSSTTCAADDVSAPNSAPYVLVKIAFTPRASGTRKASLLLAHNGVNTPNPLVVPLSGTGQFDVNAVAGETTDGYSYQTPTGNLGTLTYDPANPSTAKTSTRTIYVQNLGTYGQLNVTPALTGDKDFKIISINRNPYYTWGSASSCVNVSADGRSSDKCIAEDIHGGYQTYVAITVAFTPTAVGARKATLTLVHNGVNSPNPIVVPLSGTGAYDTTANAVETSDGYSYYATKGEFGSIAYNSTNPAAVTKTIYVQNTGHYGQLAVTPTLSGGDDFKINSVSIGPYYTWGGYISCAAVSADRKSSGKCVSEDINGGYNTYVAISISFTPKAQGARSATLTLNHNGVNTPNPIVVPLSGTGT